MTHEPLPTLNALAEGAPLDAAIIGGGINGCAIARELSSRGLRVALFEKDDFGFGTTWRSTKLIHGGLRYLEHGDLALVFESLRERAWLLRTRPHLVRPLRFLMPLLPWTRRPAWQLDVGLTAYDLLALRGGLPRHRRLGPESTGRGAPGIAANDGAFLFHDALAVSPERLALEMALEAGAFGAAIFNHTPVVRIETQNGTVSGVIVAQGESGATVPVRTVINAAGPWVDAVNQLTGENERPLLGVTKGSHIALELEGALPRAAILSTARSDGRVVFAIPRDGMLLVGTTDDRFEEPPDAVRPTAMDIGYLLAEAATLFPAAGIDQTRIRYTYSGLRPLQRAPGGPEAAIGRGHSVVDHSGAGGPAGLLSVVGGKLSTFRPLGHEVARYLGAPKRRDRHEPAGAPATGTSGRLARYGPAAETVAALGEELVCAHAGVLSGEIVHAVRSEQATTLSDIALRRTGMGWTATRGLCCHREAARLAGAELGWTPAETERQVAAFEADVRRHLPTPADVDSEVDSMA